MQLPVPEPHIYGQGRRGRLPNAANQSAETQPLLGLIEALKREKQELVDEKAELVDESAELNAQYEEVVDERDDLLDEVKAVIKERDDLSAQVKELRMINRQFKKSNK